MSTTEASPKVAVEIEAESLADREARNPFFRWLMHLGAPLSFSLVLHVSLFGVLALKVWDVVGPKSIEIGEYETTLTQSMADQLKDAFQWNKDELQTPDVKPESLEDLTSIRDIQEVDPSELAESAGPGGPDEGFGIGEGALSLLGTGGGAGEAGSGGFGGGLGAGSSWLGQTLIFGKRIKANKIIYVVDYSGSIVPVELELKRELKNAIARLKPSQSFNVIVYYSSGAALREGEQFRADAFRPGLQRVSDDARREFSSWLDKKAPSGSSLGPALKAIQLAISQRPEAIVFLTDGAFEDARGAIDDIARANKLVRARIYCMLFDELILSEKSGLPPASSPEFRTLQRISQDSGAEASIVESKDLTR